MAKDSVTWRKSSFSGSGGTGGGDCVEAARLNDDRYALRDSKNPAASLPLPAAGMAALLSTFANR
ncbi:DUF397 domain-containing protein [Actinokineospora sp. NBRC 105648]|uniref:DUF397 domain-containing protein n=1 Tax=Actinokineospora sp. NBRC 105648 TaxID=3032206 RepID=UPI0024A09BFF|nr:DUF397 domain-containing protein [Actinokineospora sp. NBRC 105648]GLZ40365.1 hypothetical protein Acsp05_39890 [Actinokineospora sp. NBRC 105648]